LVRRLGGLLRSNRFTLGGALLLAIVLPELLHPMVSGSMGAWTRIVRHGLEPTLVASALALIAAHISLRQVGMLPLVEDKALIIPSFLVSYGIALAVLFGSLTSMGRYHLVTSFVIGIGWYYLVAMVRNRLSRPRLAFVGVLPPDEELLQSRIEWQPMLRPSLPDDVLGIVVNDHQQLSPAWQRTLTRAVLRGIPVYELSQLREMVLGRVQVLDRPERVFGRLLPSLPYLRIKRTIDTIIVIPALVLALPIMAVACLLIRLESPGPPLFRQRRIGYQGRIFECYKLRSMRADIPGPAYTTEEDPRITRVGRFIRKWRIDELPQLFNILKGEMSWIGPRPEALTLSRDYQRNIPFYAYRHSVRPGISGWAAVHQGNVALVDAVTLKLEYDFYYIKYFSVWLDILVILMTIRTVVTGFGSR